MRTITEKGLVFDEKITPEQIASYVQAVADRINADYAGREPLCVVVLTGAFMYAADLFRRLQMHTDVTYIRLKSYEGLNSTGRVECVVPLQKPVLGRDVIVIEDIVDSGATIHEFKRMLAEEGARSVAVTSFLYKPTKLLFEDARPDYPALEIGDEFVVGYGLDYQGYLRNLDAVYTLRK